MQNSYGIHWFRRDLRVDGNPSLLENCKRHKGRIIGLFCFDSTFLSREDFSHNRFAFFLKTLQEVKTELAKAGTQLLVLDLQPHQAFSDLLEYLRSVNAAPPDTISFNRDYEPFSRNRDEKILKLLQDTGIEVVTERDHLILEPEELQKDAPGTYYQVYTPFARKWFSLVASAEYTDRLRVPKVATEKMSNPWSELMKGHFPFRDALDDFVVKNRRYVTIELPEAGHTAARIRLEKFKYRLKHYSELRDIPSRPGTSGLSIYFKNGSLTTAEAIQTLELKPEVSSYTDGPTTFLKEIIWREFYYHILYHCPRVESEAFIKKYRALKWPNNKEWFFRWREGQTGFPIVDAGMRQLNQTGWMHNRVRMIVASFLTKDLLIDWRWGENYFMKQLLDGDLACNNGGWQWAASTGCDPQPYFRIFNPYLQSKKFDPDGEYIRKFVPELAGLRNEHIHEVPEAVRPAGYPKPIVDHSVQKAKTLKLYGSVK